MGAEIAGPGEVVASAPGDLDALYRTHVPQALRLAALITGDRTLAEDLVQDAFVRVAARLSSLRDPDAFGPYLRRAVVNMARSHFRHQRVVRDHAERAAQRPISESHDPPDIDTRDALWDALQQLPARQRAAIVLRYYHDLPEREIAASLGCRPGTVKSLLSRGLDTLRTVIPHD